MGDLYQPSGEWPYDDKPDLFDKFRLAAAFEWAKGHAPTAEQIAEAMMKVMVPVERCEHDNIDPHREYEYVEQGPFGPLYELAVICPGSPTLVEADDE